MWAQAGVDDARVTRSQRFLLSLLPALAAPVWLATFHAEPGRLSLAHARVPRLGTGSCEACHAPQGLDAGCLACHEEIALQLKQRRGYHHALLGHDPRSCASCHSEHRGPEFHPLNQLSWPAGSPQGFRHEHLASFPLAEGRHLAVADRCEACHTPARVQALPGPDAARIRCTQSFLGLDGRCLRCHADPHQGKLEGECQSCHDQARWRPAPGFDHGRVFALDGAHARLRCDACHQGPDPAGPVRGKGCADCHADPHRDRPLQVAFTAASTDCASCHGTQSFAPQALSYAPASHAPGRFPLLGRHVEAGCRACHARPEDALTTAPSPAAPSPAAPLAVAWPARLPASLRGLGREQCASCHRDVHAGGGKADGGKQVLQLATQGQCAGCHEERTWAPTSQVRADHARHGFPLSGGHGGVACARCHEAQPRARAPGAGVRTCAECHATPHRARFTQACSSCHSAERPDWREARFSVQDHALTGFALQPPHDRACDSCHAPAAPYAQRFRPVKLAECRTCHPDPHLGQFDLVSTTGRGSTTGQASTTGRVAAPADCASCHAGTRWRPSTFDAARHARTPFPLQGKHASAACEACHPVQHRPRPTGEVVAFRPFRGRERACKSCHQDPHQGQFASTLASADCTACHDAGEKTWRVTSFAHERTRFPLQAAHAQVACARCHTPQAGQPVRYRPLETACAACHRDPHAGQFRLARGAESRGQDPERCERCHDLGRADWRLPAFPHDQTRFPLDGAHQNAPCASCHRPYRLQDGRTVVRYWPLERECKDCHGSFPRRDQD